MSEAREWLWVDSLDPWLEQASVVQLRRGRPLRRTASALQVLRGRAFEPHLLPRHVGDNTPFDVPDLSALSRLLHPQELTRQLAPGLDCRRHAVTVVPVSDGRCIYVPAILWIQALWARRSKWIAPLLTPGGLDAVLPPLSVGSSGEPTPTQRRFLGPSSSTESGRWVSWLAGSADARASWSSVLSNAIQGCIDVRLPAVSVRGWAWGTTVAGGLAAAELMSLSFGFGRDEARCVPTARRRFCTT